MEAVKTRPYLSVEFFPSVETRTAGGVREVERALLVNAALVAKPEYPQATAEVREAASEENRMVWL